jgi:hypothetical protein
LRIKISPITPTTNEREAQRRLTALVIGIRHLTRFEIMLINILAIGLRPRSPRKSSNRLRQLERAAFTPEDLSLPTSTSGAA